MKNTDNLNAPSQALLEAAYTEGYLNAIQSYIEWINLHSLAYFTKTQKNYLLDIFNNDLNFIKELTMSNETVAQEIANSVNQAVQNVPLVEGVAAAINTFENPTPEILLSDFQLLHNLYSDIKSKLAGKHPHLLDMLAVLLKRTQ